MSNASRSGYFLIDQMVAAGQTLYITLVGLEQQAADGQRSLAALDRSLEELRLRQQLGQVSRQNVDEVEAQRTQVVSQLNTLDTTIDPVCPPLEYQTHTGPWRPPGPPGS